MYYTYMLRCEDNSIYTGITTDLKRRMKEHFEKSDKCAKYTLNHNAKKLEAVWETENKSLASKLESQIKKLSKKNKEELIKDSGKMEILLGDRIDCNQYKTLDKG